MIPTVTTQPLQKPVRFGTLNSRQSGFSLKAIPGDTVLFGARRGSLLPIDYNDALRADMAKHPSKYQEFRRQVNSGEAFPPHYTGLLDYLKHQGWSIELERQTPIATVLQTKVPEPIDPINKIIRVQIKNTKPAESLQQDIAQGVAKAINIDGLGIIPPNAKLSKDESYKELVKPLMDEAYGTSRHWAQHFLHGIGGADPKKDPSGQGLFEARVKDLLLGKTPYTAGYEPENELKAVYKAVDLLLEQFRD